MTTDRHLDTLEMMLNMGPQHPATHGVFRMVLWIDGERIVDVEPHIGYLHRGSEKRCEGEQYSQIITLFDRMDYLSNFNNELVLCAAVEKLMDIEVPERAQFIRVIMSELNRISSHMMFYGAFGGDCGGCSGTRRGCPRTCARRSTWRPLVPTTKQCEPWRRSSDDLKTDQNGSRTGGTKSPGNRH